MVESEPTRRFIETGFSSVVIPLEVEIPQLKEEDHPNPSLSWSETEAVIIRKDKIVIPLKIENLDKEGMILFWIPERREWVGVFSKSSFDPKRWGYGESCRGPYALDEYYARRILDTFQVPLKNLELEVPELSLDQVLHMSPEELEEIAGERLFGFQISNTNFWIVDRNGRLQIEAPHQGIPPAPLDLPAPRTWNTSTAFSTSDRRGETKLSFKLLFQEKNLAAIDVDVHSVSEYWYYGSLSDDWMLEKDKLEMKHLIVSLGDDSSIRYKLSEGRKK